MMLKASSLLRIDMPKFKDPLDSELVPAMVLAGVPVFMEANSSTAWPKTLLILYDEPGLLL